MIIGCGNDDRADDAAGLIAVRRLRELGVEAHEHSGEMLSLMEAWIGEPEVILIDALVSGAEVGAISVWDASGVKLPAVRFRSSTHAFGLAEAIELARVLTGNLPPKVTIYGIEAANCEMGGPISPEVEEAARVVARMIAESSPRTS